MPKREDEYWAGMKEPKGRGLCPFCGSSNIYYNKRYESWRCAKCEKSFPSPSYGPGEDFGREARWFGKTTEEIRQREFAEVAREARAKKGKHRRRSGRLPGWLIPAVVIVPLVMFGTVAWELWGSEIGEFFSGSTNTYTEEATSPSSVETEATGGAGDESPSLENGVEVRATASEVANLFYILVNEKRVENGLHPLKESSLLEELAIEHSENMALTGHFGHERLGWRSFTFGQLPGTIRGENLSMTPKQQYVPGPFLSSEEVVAWAVEGLLGSPGHRANMLSKTFTHTGVGVVMSDGYFYITQIFDG